MSPKRVAHKEWTLAMRLTHWIMVISIVVLIGTGFYIAKPFTIYSGETFDKFLMGDIRFIHLLFGIFLLFSFIWRLYLAFFSKFHADWKDFLAFTDWKNLMTQIRFYLLISDEKPEHKYLYGPLQSLAYGGLMVMLFLILLTGLILMGAGYDAGLTAWIYALVKPFETMMGGLATVRWIHHILTWLFVIFVVVHIYMAFWYDVVFEEGTVSSMVGGRIFRKEKH